MATKYPYTLLIVEDQKLGPVAITVFNTGETHIHLPHPIEDFPPFGSKRSPNMGKLLGKYIDWEIKNPKRGNIVRIKNTLTGEISEPRQVLAVYHDNQIEMTIVAKKIAKEYLEVVLRNIKSFTSDTEYSGYKTVIQSYFWLLNKCYPEQIKYDELFLAVARDTFSTTTTIESNISDLFKAGLFYQDGDLVKITPAMWYLIIFKINRFHYTKPPFFLGY